MTICIKHKFPKVILLEKMDFIKGLFIMDIVIAMWEGMELEDVLAQTPSSSSLILKAYCMLDWHSILAILKAQSFGH